VFCRLAYQTGYIYTLFCYLKEGHIWCFVLVRGYLQLWLVLDPYLSLATNKVLCHSFRFGSKGVVTESECTRYPASTALREM